VSHERDVGAGGRSSAVWLGSPWHRTRDIAVRGGCVRGVRGLEARCRVREASPPANTGCCSHGDRPLWSRITFCAVAVQQNPFSLAGSTNSGGMHGSASPRRVRIISALLLCVALAAGCDQRKLGEQGTADSTNPVLNVTCGDEMWRTASLGNALRSVRSALVFVESNQQRAKLMHIEEMLVAGIDVSPDSALRRQAIESSRMPEVARIDAAFREGLRTMAERARTKAQLDEVTAELRTAYGDAIEQAARMVAPSSHDECRREEWSRLHTLLIDALGSR
jgi:hypothetical protein